MSWPKKTWKYVDGEYRWVDFKTPGPGKPDELFPDDWKHYKNTVDNSNYWDAIDNPLYEAAANASGIDWEKWVADSLAEIGTEEDYQAAVDYADEYLSSSGGRGYAGAAGIAVGMGMGNHPWFSGMNQDEKDDAWDNLTPTQQNIVKNLPSPTSSGGQSALPFGQGPMGAGAIAGMSASQIAGAGGVAGVLFGMLEDGEDPPINWGFNRSAYGSVAEDLDDMHEWLTKTLKTHSLQDMPIIERGPQGSDYGIDGDIWAHYGLEKPILPPKEMNVNYEFNLAEARPSTKGYLRPAGYPELDTRTHTVAGPTHYERWTEQKRQEAAAAHAAAENTSYGEPVSSVTSDTQESRRWTDNVQSIIGKDSSVDDWAKAAGVDNLNSRSDSDKIKEVYRAAGGVLSVAAGIMQSIN